MIFKGKDGQMKGVYTVDDVQEILNVKRAKAYEIIRELNKELEEEGYTTLKGRVIKSKFESSYLYKNIQEIG